MYRMLLGIRHPVGVSGNMAAPQPLTQRDIRLAIRFVTEMKFEVGVIEQVAPMVRRVIAGNPGPFTFHGTGTYILGRGEVAIIDPGPAIEAHVDALLTALAGETVTHQLITHTHLDHSPAARLVGQATGAPTYGFGPHGGGGGGPAVEEGADRDFVPDVVLGDGDVVDGAGWRVAAVHTPGHTSNHLCFALDAERTLFSGDHVMGWSTSVIAPPDGDMAAYRASLARLLERDDRVYWPTHGPAIDAPKRHVRAFLDHRAARERQVLACLADGVTTIADMVAPMYPDLAAGLAPAARRSVLAHLIELVDRGVVACDGAPEEDVAFEIVGGGA